MLITIEQILNIKGHSLAGRPDLFYSSQESLENDLFKIKSYFSYIWLLNISYIKEYDEKKVLRYLFLDVESGYDFLIQVDVTVGIKAKSITHLWRNSGTIEHRIHSIHNIEFTRSYNNLYTTRSNAISESSISLNGVRRISSKVRSENLFNQNFQYIDILAENDIVKKCHIGSGNYHIGLESILEASNNSKVFQIIESYYPLKAIFWSHIISANYEDNLGIQLSDRSQAIRMVMLELSRVMNHVHYFYNLSKYYKFSALFENCTLWIKTIQSLFLSYTGNEFGVGVIRPGGLIKDISQVWLTRTASEIVKLENSILSVYKTIILKKSTKSEFSYSLVSKKMASSWSLSGPIVRAVGINLDCRKLRPCYFYEHIDFEVPVGTQGKAYDLIIVKMEEIFQSLKIIVQVLDNLPTGPIMSEKINEFIVLKSSDSTLNEDDYRKSIKDYLELKDMDQCKYFESSNGIFGISQFRKNLFSNFNVMTNELALKSLFEKSVVNNPVEFIPPLWEIMGLDLKEVER